MKHIVSHYMSCSFTSDVALCSIQEYKETKKHFQPVSPHQVGQPLMSFTTPDWNMSRNSNQRTSQNGIASLRAEVAARRFDCDWYLSGATRMDTKPASNSSMSLEEGEKKGFYVIWLGSTRCAQQCVHIFAGMFNQIMSLDCVLY
jgi:hypothetical protein